MKTQLLILLFIATTSSAMTLEEYLPQTTRYDNSIPTPPAVSGVNIGLRHYRHDQIVQYMSVLAASSPRAKLVDYGITNEGRRLVLLIVSSEQNIARFDSLHEDDNILKVWNGFSVHGNEASGANASVLYAYHLVAGYESRLQEILNETVIIIDPTINPDGYDRYVTDVNAMRGMIDNTDSNDASHQESTPNGRTNHYWFDLNRDWLLLTQVESQARIRQFHIWQPHVLDDHHEMGSDRTFFFQPGVPERTNPLIPKRNIELTNKLGEYHASALSARGMSFYTKESYDDFYPGKGSTYPDLQGSVGILFEQAKAKGGQVQTDEGLRTLFQAIDNQFQTALSTLNGAYDMRNELKKYKKDFFNSALQQAGKSDHSGYVLSFEGNLHALPDFVMFMSQHQIQVQALNKNLEVERTQFAKESSVFVPVKQPQFNLIESLFSTQKQFKDNTFYDVSSWNLPMAWGLKYKKVKGSVDTVAIDMSEFKASAPSQFSNEAVAYVFDWNEGNSAAAVQYLMSQGLTLKASTKAFEVRVNGKTKSLQPGAIVLSVNNKNKQKALKAISEINEFYQVSSVAVTSGLSVTGVDLGSPSIKTLKQPKILMVIGEGVDSYQAGSLWHLIDTQIGLPVTKITQSQLKKIRLEKYSHLILPSGQYSEVNENHAARLIEWVETGGHVIALQQAAGWSYKNLLKGKVPEKDKDNSARVMNYADFDAQVAENTIGGAIIAATADLTHPLAYGMTQSEQFVLLKGGHVLTPSENPYATPLKANEKALAAGYVSVAKQKEINSSSLVIAEKLRKGSVIRMGFNPNFRGFWKGTHKWMINCIFFADLIKSTEIK